MVVRHRIRAVLLDPMHELPMFVLEIMIVLCMINAVQSLPAPWFDQDRPVAEFATALVALVIATSAYAVVCKRTSSTHS